MIEIWRMAAKTATVALRGLGFSTQEAAHLVELKVCCNLRDLDDLTDMEKRFLFVRWLVRHGRLSEGELVSQDDGQRYPAAGRKRKTSRRFLNAWWLSGAVMCWPASALCEHYAASLYWSSLPM